MQSSTEHRFNFFSEISKENAYHLLFPPPKVGLAVIWLYERILNGVFPDKTFKEADIHEALKGANVDLKTDSGRQPREHYNLIVSDLQEYFIRYHEDRQVYTLKEYANEFCKHASETLKATFDPTQIEKICAVLRERLETRKNVDQIIEWFNLEFQTFKPELRKQIDFLDIQIDHSVLALRQNKELNLREGDIINTLQQIDARFDNIRKQNKELRTAFREIELIRKKLEEFSNLYDDDTINTHSYSAVTFFQEMRQTLSTVDKRLDKIQPRIKQLFSNLNKPLFNSRVEKFLHFLIEKSDDSFDGKKKKLMLPEGIPTPVLWEHWANFIIVERKSDLFPQQVRKRLIISETIEGKKAAFEPIKEKLAQQDEISDLVSKIRSEVDKSGKVYFSIYFLEILESGGPKSLSLAIGVTYRAIKFFERIPDYELSIYPEKIITNSAKQVALWEMTIQKR